MCDGSEGGGQEEGGKRYGREEAKDLHGVKIAKKKTPQKGRHQGGGATTRG